MAELGIVLATDRKFVGLTSITLKSIRRVGDVPAAEVYVLSSGLTADDKTHIKGAAQDWEVSFLEVDSVLGKIESFGVDLSRVPAISAARLACADLLPTHITKALYLDSDILVTGSLSELLDFDMSNCMFAGVAERIEDQVRKRIGLEACDLYINAGVLLMNLVDMRRDSFTEKSLDFLAENAEAAVYLDQDAINSVARGRILSLPLKYNVIAPLFFFSYEECALFRRSNSWYYTKREYDEAVKNPVIVHFTNGFPYARPWYKNSNHPYASLYQEYMKSQGVELFGDDNRSRKQRATSLLMRHVHGKLRGVVPSVLRTLNHP